MRKGFTLIELLAVIVILAIIAIIATPVILNIINDARISSEERSVDLFQDAIVNAVVSQYQKNPQVNLAGNYTTTDGKTLVNTVDSSKTITISYDGNIVICDTIEVTKDGQVSVYNCKVGNNSSNIINTKDNLIPTAEQLESANYSHDSSLGDVYFFTEASFITSNNYLYYQSTEGIKALSIGVSNKVYIWLCDDVSASAISAAFNNTFEANKWYVTETTPSDAVLYEGSSPISISTFNTIYSEEYVTRVINSFNN